MQNYVISLQDATHRRNHIKAEFGKQGIPFQFCDAITPDKLYNFEMQTSINLSKAVKLSKGEKACFASHIFLWEKMLKENKDYVAIFEDDILLGENADIWLNNSSQLNKLRSEGISFDLIKLETFQTKVSLGKKITVNTDKRGLYHLKSMHTGAGAYIISKQGAKKLLSIIKALPSERIMPIDHLLFDDYLKQIKTYQLTPALCIQGMFIEENCNDLKSSLDASRLEEKEVTDPHKSQLNKKQKFSRFLKRLYRSIGKRTFFKLIDFK